MPHVMNENMSAFFCQTFRALFHRDWVLQINEM
jgi:hypothetical protein